MVFVVYVAVGWVCTWFDGAGWGGDGERAGLVGGVPDVVMALLVIGLVRYEYGLGLAEIGLRISNPLRAAVVGIGAGAFLMILVGAVNWALAPERSDHPIVLPRVFGAAIMPGLALVALTAFSEELYFRGLVYVALRRRMGSRVAACAMSAVLFAGVHLYDPRGFVAMMVFAIAVTALLELTGSLVPAMVAHAVFNAAVMVAHQGV